MAIAGVGLVVSSFGHERRQRGEDAQAEGARPIKTGAPATAAKPAETKPETKPASNAPLAPATATARVDFGAVWGMDGTRAKATRGHDQLYVGGHVQAGPGAVQGFCKEGDVRKVVSARQAGIRYCYEKELARDPELQGKVTVDWRIGIDGKVMKVMVESSTLSSKEVEACMTRQIARWTFPRPEGGMCQIRYPFEFKAGP